MNSKILVAIPAYNCEKQIVRVLKGFDSDLLSKISKVVVIDNISSDNTASVALEYINKINPSKFEVWRNNKNYNLGGSHKVAFLYAEKNKMDYVAILHGDDQADTKELDLLINEASQHPEAGAILGSRFMKGSSLKGYSVERIIGNRIINLIYSIVALRPSLDLGSGLNLFRVEDLKDHRYLGFEDSITFNIDLLLDYFKKKTNIRFIPISWKEEDQVSNAKNFAVGRKAMIKLLRWRFNKERFAQRKASYYTSSRIK